MQAEIVDEKALVVAASAELERQRFMPVMNMDMALERRAVIKKAIGSLLEEGGDFGVIPGTGTKPTLLQPGAQKLDSLFGLVPRFELVDKCEDWTGVDHNGEPFFRYLTRCVLYRGDFAMGEGLGECNSWESKYRWRKAERKCPTCQKENIRKSKNGDGWYCWAKTGGCGSTFEAGDKRIESQEAGRVPNGDIFDQVNTLLKMANKRAHVAATINTTSASEFFTQDMEDSGQQPTWAEGEAAAKSVADQKIKSMRNGASYQEASAHVSAPAPSEDDLRTHDARVEETKELQRAISALLVEMTDGENNGGAAEKRKALLKEHFDTSGWTATTKLHTDTLRSGLAKLRAAADAGSTKVIWHDKFDMLDDFARIKADLNQLTGATGEAEYYRVLKANGVEKSNQFKDMPTALKAYQALEKVKVLMENMKKPEPAYQAVDEDVPF